MGISKLSEKCEKCDRNNTCDDKRMGACAYIIPTMPDFAKGGIVSNNGLFMEHESGCDLIGGLNNRKGMATDNEEVIKAIQKGVSDAINKCVFKVVV